MPKKKINVNSNLNINQEINDRESNNIINDDVEYVDEEINNNNTDNNSGNNDNNNIQNKEVIENNDENNINNDNNINNENHEENLKKNDDSHEEVNKNAEEDFDKMADKFEKEVDFKEDVGGFLDDLFGDVHEDIARQSSPEEIDIVQSTNNIRKNLRTVLGVKPFSSLSAKSLEKLENTGITDPHGLLSFPDETQDLSSIKDEYVGNKTLTKDAVGDIVKLYKSALKTHEGRGIEPGDSIAFDDEKRAIDECQMILARKGVNSIMLDSMVNARNEEAFNKALDKAFDSTLHYAQNQKYLKTLHLDANSHLGNIDKMNEIIGKHGVEDLAPDQLQAYKNRLNADAGQNKDKLKEAMVILKGPTLKEASLDQAIAHLWEQERALKAMDETNKLYKNYKESFYKQIETLSDKGLSTKDVRNLINAYGTDEYKNIKSPLLESINCQCYLDLEVEDNLNVFYDRIAKVFDVKTYDIGSELNKANVNETVNVLKEMNGYKKQLTLTGKIAEANHLNNHIEKVSKFLIAKGVDKESFKDLIESKPEELKDKADKFMENREKILKENNEITDKNISVTTKDGKVQITINLGEKQLNFAKDIEQFPDVKQVPDKDKVFDNDINKDPETPAKKSEIIEESNIVNDKTELNIIS